jgi:hypothetical protein
MSSLDLMGGSDSKSRRMPFAVVHRSRAVASVAALLVLCCGRSAHAQNIGTTERGPLDFRARLAFGVGSHESTLPTANGTEHVTPHTFSAWGFELRAAAVVADRLRIGGVVSYASSIGDELTRQIFSSGAESSPARSQELGVHALGELELTRAWVLPVMLGYTFDAFRTDLPLTAAASYLLTGPRLAAGLQLTLFDARLRLLALPEIGAIVTASDALVRAGLARQGLEYGWTAEIGVRLGYHLQLGVRYREARSDLALQGAGAFRDSQRFVLGCLSWVNR